MRVFNLLNEVSWYLQSLGWRAGSLPQPTNLVALAYSLGEEKSSCSVLFVVEPRFLREAFGAVILISGRLWGEREKYLK